MQEVTIAGSRMFIWAGLHAESGENLRILAPEVLRIFVLTDHPCLPIARRVAMSLQQNRYEVSGGAAPAIKGPAKEVTIATLKGKLAKLGPNGTCVVAVGGSALLHLGVQLARERPLFFIPTTLRGQLDTAIGGSPCPRLRGAWKAPHAVFADPTLLQEMPLREFVAGLADAVKCGMVQDADLFEFIESKAIGIRDRNRDVLEELIHRSATVKAAAIGTATPGPGARATLRYGHLIGGAVEGLAGASVLHGEAISVGMEAEAFLARKLGWMDEDSAKAQNRVLKAMGLPTRAKGLPVERLVQPLLSRTLAAPDLPDSVGHTRGPAALTPELLKAAIAAVTK